MALTFNDITLSLGGVKQLKQEPRTTRKEGICAGNGSLKANKDEYHGTNIADQK
jgi:hypothetical protein